MFSKNCILNYSHPLKPQKLEVNLCHSKSNSLKQKLPDRSYVSVNIPQSSFKHAQYFSFYLTKPKCNVQSWHKIKISKLMPHNWIIFDSSPDYYGII